MRKLAMQVIGSLLLSLGMQSCTAAALSAASLCHLQRQAKQGERQNVRVEGLYSNGLEVGVLTDSACRSQRTWVEFDLRSKENKDLLRSTLDAKGHARVVFEGEFFGPGKPDPNLPEAIRKSYQPGWGHLGAFKTKLVVHVIQSVKPD
jgi:hypothetical protein